jgi:hypothetical protein
MRRNKSSRCYPVSNIHGSASGYRYRSRQNDLDESYANVLDRGEVNDDYRTSVSACVRDLGLSAATSEQLLGDWFAVAV